MFPPKRAALPLAGAFDTYVSASRASSAPARLPSIRKRIDALDPRRISDAMTF